MSGVGSRANELADLVSRQPDPHPPSHEVPLAVHMRQPDRLPSEVRYEHWDVIRSEVGRGGMCTIHTYGGACSYVRRSVLTGTATGHARRTGRLAR
jgi:hypothetical protein